MSEPTAQQVRPQLRTVPSARGVLQRKCACTDDDRSGQQCSSCSGEDKVHGQATSRAGPSGVPPVVGKVLRSSGHSLNPTTRSFFEPRLQHDFSRVRVHTDQLAVEAARSVNATAFTLGRDIVFGAAQYQPGTHGGRKLLAHELLRTISKLRIQARKSKEKAS
ncbi:MAG: hypothetical protein QOJ93_1770 [Actinomycetota bacterium]|nr:hypothetical protein [Actinomycetota bacterium]